MRVFKNKWFARWARAEGIADQRLWQTAAEVVGGRFEADLGGGLVKKRLARPGSGKRGGYRVLIGYRRPNQERIFFLYAFGKNVQATLTPEEKEALRLVAGALLAATDDQIALLLQKGSLMEVSENE